MFSYAKKKFANIEHEAASIIDNVSGKVVGVVGVASGFSLIPQAAYAVPVDLTTLTAAVDFSTAITAILLVAAALAGVYIAWKAAKMVLAALRGG